MDGYNVSIIVPTYNRANYIRECLDSLVNQSVPAFEIIVVDDGSKDDTSKIVRSFGDKVIYFYKENEGKPAALNLAMSHVRGNLIWIFDDDDIALPNAIETRVNALREDSGAGFVYTPHHLGYDGTDGRILKAGLSSPPCIDDADFFYELLKGCFFHLCSALVKVEAYKEVGAFDKQLLGSEDYDMQIRLARTFRGVFSPEPSFVFRQHSGLRGAGKIRYEAKDRSRIFHRYGQLIGLKLYDHLSLGEYLAPAKTSNLTDKERLEALLKRVVVMAGKGCIDKMFDDLTTFLKQSAGNFGVVEENQIKSAMTTGFAYASIQSGWPSFKERLRALKKYPGGKRVAYAFAKGLFRLAKSYPGTLFEKLARLRLAISIILI